MSDDERHGDEAAVPRTEILPAATGGDRRGMVLVTAGNEVGRAFRIEAGKPVTIGRVEGTLVVDDSGLSRLHAEFSRVGDDYVVRDMGSTNGTFVNDARVDFVTLLADGDRIRIGTRTRLRFSLVDLAEESGLLHLHDASARARLLVETAGGGAPPRPSDPGAPGPVVLDPAMRALYEQANRAARATISVLLLGETGVGKEVLAQAIHMASPRATKPFLALHCAALAETLLEAELFGHEKGAFTGAVTARPGLFESADGGTVFLDEVGELPLSIQVKLLRVLERREVLRVGARTPHPVDVRFLSATNRDLEAEAERGAFRQDLFFRLNGMSLTIPPLRERLDEIPHLAELFIGEASRQAGRASAPVVSRAALEVLSRHRWPGNVRELRNVIERGVVLCSGDTLLPEHLPAKMTGAGSGSAPSSPPAEPDSLRSELGALERQRILAALEACGGNQTHAAERLGMSRRTLVTRLHEWGLTKPRRSKG